MFELGFGRWLKYGLHRIIGLGCVGIGTTSPTAKLCVDPGGAGGVIVGNPSTTSGGGTSLSLSVSAASNGFGSVQSVSTAGSVWGALALNPQGGHVGVGTGAPGTFRLAVNGEAAKPGGGSWAVFSDWRLKRDIAPMTGTLDKLLSLRGYTFKHRPEAVEKRLARGGRAEEQAPASGRVADTCRSERRFATGTSPGGCGPARPATCYGIGEPARMRTCPVHPPGTLPDCSAAQI
jgi:hypothetical protein